MLGHGLNSLIPDRHQSSESTPPSSGHQSSAPLSNNQPSSDQAPPPSVASSPAPAENQSPPPVPLSPISPSPLSKPAAPPVSSINPTSSPDISSPPTPPTPPPPSSTNSTFPARPASDHVFQLEIEKIKPNPFQPRRQFDEQSLRDLAASISEFGIIQPLVVSKNIINTPTGTDVEYELIAGERRLRAAELAGLRLVPAIIKNPPPPKEKLELAIIENLQREDLNPIESARAFSRLQDEFGLTQREIAVRLGKSRETVANTMRLLSLPTYIQEAVAFGQVGESQARLLLTIADFTTQQHLFEDLIKNNLTVRELRQQVMKTNARANAVSRFEERDPEIRHLEERLTELFGTRVRVEKNGTTGKITISFSSEDELKNILGRVIDDREL